MHRDSWRELKQDQWFIAGSATALLCLFLVVAGPWFASHDPNDISFSPLSAPSTEHWLGVNDGAMDILAELLHGMRKTAGFGLLSGSAGLGLGIFIGLAAACFGGMAERFLMGLGEILLAILAVMILILAAMFFRPAPVVLAFLLAFLSWPTTAKAIRAQALLLKESLHVRAAWQMGASSAYILLRHLLPELYLLYLMGFAGKVRSAVLMEASLAFLGLLDPNRKSLGIIIKYALKYYYLDVRFNWLLPPIACLTLLVMSLTCLVISLEKLFDPRLREWWW